MKYPKYFNECPICHCTERIVEQEVNEAKKEGKIGKERIATSQQRLLPIVDPTLTRLSFPVLLIYMDFCAGCGFEYPHTILKQPNMTQEQLLALMGVQPQRMR